MNRMNCQRFLPSALILGVFLSASAGTAQTVRERISVDVVTVWAAARDASGRPVRDLAAADLSLFVDGKPVAIDTLANSPERAAPASRPGASVSDASRVDLAPAPSPRPRPLAMVIVADESQTKSFDRRDVYDEVSRFLRAQHPGEGRFLVTRFNGNRLRIECPWTSDTAAALAAISRLRDHPGIERSPSELIELQMMRKRLHAALLEALALFPDTPDRREVLFISGGTTLEHPADIGATLQENSVFERVAVSRLETDERRRVAEMDRDRDTFQLWSRAVTSGGPGLTMGDVVAKALERDVALIPVGAEAFDRGTNPGVDSRNPSRPIAGDRRLSAHMGVGQAMTAIAEDTGTEPILVPRRTAARLAEIQERASLAITFRDPAADDHRYHRIELACRRPGVHLDYKRGYRISTEEERALDGVFASFLQPDPKTDPLGVTAFLSGASAEDGRAISRLGVRYAPPVERVMGQEREIQILAVGEDGKGNRTEPIRWSGTARRVEGAGTFEAELSLGVPPGSFAWSIAVRDQPTGLTAFVLVRAKP